MKKLIFAFAALALVGAIEPACAQLIGSGHVMGNGSSSARTPTDVPLLQVLQQSGSGLGSGVGSALGTNVGTAGSVVVNGGALGTPASGNLANANGLPILGGVSGLGSGVATALGAAANSSGGFVTQPVAPSSLASQAANTVLGALTATTPSALSLPSCSTSASALQFTLGTGFSCNTAIAAPAASLTGNTLASGITASSLTSAAGGAFGTLAYANAASPPAIGGTTPNSAAFTSLSASLGIAASQGITIASYTPGVTTNALYNVGGNLYFNGVALSTGSSVVGTTGYLGYFTGTNSIGSSAIYQSGGLIGVGTTSPSYHVDIGNGTANVEILRLNAASSGTNAGPAVFFADGGTNQGAIGGYSAIYGGAYNPLLTVYDSNGVLLNPGGGPVGINMLSPIYPLDVGGTIRTQGLATQAALEMNGAIFDIRAFGALCNGTTDDTAAINSALSAAASANTGAYVIVPGGFTCAFASTINLQDFTTLKIMPNASMKFIGTGGDEILGAAATGLDDRQNIEGPGQIDARNATSGTIIHYKGGASDVIRNLTIQTNSGNVTAVALNANPSITFAPWNSGLIDRLNVDGKVGTGLFLEGATNNSFRDITIYQPVTQRCVYAPDNNDTEYFYNLNCGDGPAASGSAGIVIGSATGVTQAISSGAYNSTSGVTTITLVNTPTDGMVVGATVTLAGLTGTGGYASLNGSWNVTGIAGKTITFTSRAGFGATTISGGNLAVTDTDAWGYQFFGYITSGGTYSIALYETHDNSFFGGNDSQGTANPGITNFTGPGIGPMSVPATYVACHAPVLDNTGYMCASHLPYKVANLPTGANIDIGARVYVTDATSCPFMTGVSGGGSTFCPVIWNGTNWVAD